MLFFGKSGEALRFAFYIVNVPLALEVLPLVLCCGKNCGFAAICALDRFLFFLLLLLRLLRLHLYFLRLLLFFLELIQ